MGAPRTRQELVEALRRARVAQGLSLRAAARQVGLPASTLQGWFEGRHLPTPQLQDDFLNLLRVLRLTDEGSAHEWALMLERLRSGGEIGANPYPGIRSFAADDAESFFGRDRVLAELVDAIRRASSGVGSSRIVALVGLSGSGKTSLLQAGLAGRECADGGRLSEFSCVPIQPGDLPSWKPADDRPTLLIVDSLELLRGLEQPERDAAVATLAALPATVTCVVAIVADAFEFAVGYEALRRALSAPVLVGGLDDSEFSDIIVEPARLSGRGVEDSLVSLILRDLHRYGEPTAQVLPVLSNALFRAWEEADGPTVRIQDYLAIGGVWGGLERLAEGLYLAATPADQVRIRGLFIALVQVSSEGIERRSLALSAIPDESAGVVEAFLGARLLSLVGRELTISHTALLGKWARLGSWVEEEREQLLFRRRIGKAAEVWAESNRDPQALIPVAASVFDQLARDTGVALSPLEAEFVEASVARAEQATEDHRREVMGLRRRNALMTVLAVVAIAGLMLAAIMVYRAEAFRAGADEARAQAQSRQLALIAEETRPTDRNLAAQLSLAALRTSATIEAEAAVLKSAGLQAPRRTIGAPGTVRLVAAANLVIRASGDGTVSGWSPDEGEPAFSFAATDGQLFGVAHANRSGRSIVAVAGQGTASLWDVTGEPARLGEFGAATVGYSAAIGPDTAYFGLLDGTIARIDLATLTPLPPLITGVDRPVEGLAVHPSGTLVVSSGGSQVLAWDGDGTQRPPYPTERPVTQAVFSPDGTSLAVAGAGGRASLLDVSSTGELSSRSEIEFGTLTLHSLAYDGERLFVGAWDGTVGAFSNDGRPLGQFTEPATVTGLALSGARVVTGTIDGAMRSWPQQYAGTLVEGSATPTPTALTGQHIVNYFDDYAGVYHLDGSPEHRLAFTEDAGSGQGPVLASGHVISLPTQSGRLASWDAGSSEAAPPVWSTVADGNAYELFSGPAGYAAYAEAGRDYVTVIKRDGLRWEPVARVSTWSTLAMGWHPTRPLLAAMSTDSHRLVIHDLASGTPRVLGEVEVPRSGASIRLMWSGPDERIYAGTDAGVIFLVDVSDPSSPVVTPASADVSAGVSSLSVDEDGARVAAGLVDGRIYVWDVNGDNFEIVALLRPGLGPISGLRFAGDRLVFATYSDGVFSWPLDAAAAADHLCSTVGDPLSDGEWRRMVPGVDPVDGCPG